MTVAMAYDAPTDQLRVEDGRDRLVALLYHEKFTKHADARRGIALVLEQLRGSGMSQRTKDSLPTPERIDTTVRNVNWVLRYWRCEPTCPDPVDVEFGYRQIKGVTHYLDAA